MAKHPLTIDTTATEIHETRSDQRHSRALHEADTRQNIATVSQALRQHDVTHVEIDTTKKNHITVHNGDSVVKKPALTEEVTLVSHNNGNQADVHSQKHALRDALSTVAHAVVNLAASKNNNKTDDTPHHTGFVTIDAVKNNATLKATEESGRDFILKGFKIKG